MAYAKTFGHKRDREERPIIEALTALGASVLQVSGAGLPDLLVGFRGVNYLIEVKSGKRGKLTDAQLETIMAWQGTWHTVKSVDEAIEVLNDPDSEL